MKRLVLFIFIFILSLNAQSLQEVLNNAPSGAILKLPNGVYNGKIIISKPVTILGMGNNVIIKGDNQGRVISINSSDVILQNITITNSGDRIENLDSAILMNKVKNCIVDSCKILNSLYGIDMNRVQNCTILNNYITSKNNPISLKGDAIKLWYSKNNIIKNNIMDSTKDVKITFSNNNTFINNTFINNRFGLHLTKSDNNIIKNNTFKYNSVALMVMGSYNTKIFNNHIKSSKGAAGIGVVLDGTKKLLFENNIVSFNAKGLYINSKSIEEGMQRYIKNNEISYNGEALHFHEAIKNNTITNNKIFGNIEDVVKDVRGTYTLSNKIEYNYWDRYAGFDINKDNIGDTTHKNFQYADQLWHYNHKIKFFYASPIMSLLNFLANLAPFVEPIMLLEDTKPLIKNEE